MNKKIKAYVGIDVGKTGCLCVLTEANDIHFFDFPKDEKDIGMYFNNLKDTVYSMFDVRFTALERVHALPKQSTQSGFTFGMNYGYWNLFLSMLNVPHDLITPQKWMKKMNIAKADGLTTKQQVERLVSRIFPKAELYGTKGAYKTGRGDALLIAYYAKQVC